MKHHVYDREEADKDAKTSIFFFKGTMKANVTVPLPDCAYFVQHLLFANLHFKLYPKKLNFPVSFCFL